MLKFKKKYIGFVPRNSIFLCRKIENVLLFYSTRYSGYVWEIGWEITYRNFKCAHSKCCYSTRMDRYVNIIGYMRLRKIDNFEIF